MRFLIVFSAALACAAAAPSHWVPFAPYTVQGVAIPAAVPTISSGDLQAAAIDAHVKAADLAQEAIDKARLVTDQAAEDFNAKSITNVDQEKERLAEGFWSIEDKKWQALDALKTAEAQFDGAIGSKADILAKTAVGAPYIAAAVPAVAPIAPAAPVVYSGYAAPGLKSFSSQTLVQTHPIEAAKAEGDSEKVEAAVKAAEPAATPSHLVPFAPYTVQAVAIPAALPTISSGDLQAAAIDAHVKAADLAQEAIDKARLVTDQAAEDFNAKSITNVDQEKERLAEGFWSIEDKKWQALDALKTAEAQFDGAIGSKADILAKTAVGARYIAAAVPALAPVVYSGYVAPGLKSFSSQTLVQTHPIEAAKAEGDSLKVEAAVKAAEPAATPSHLVPFAPYTVQAVAIPAALPTISSGDLQAAAIDAHVKAADLAQEAIDKARLNAEQAAEDFNAKSITNDDLEKERLAAGFWSIEDKKWQNLDALKTAEAQLDGAIASKADILAKTAVGAPYVAAAVPTVPHIAPVAPVVYSGYVAPGLKSFSSQTLIQTHPAEAAKAEGDSEKVEAAVKAAEPAAEKAEAAAEKPVEAAAYAAAGLKSEADKALAALQAPAIEPVAISSAFPYAGYTGAYPYSGLAIAPAALAQPGFKYANTIQNCAIPHATFFKTQW